MKYVIDNKDTTTEEDIKLQWHPAFCSAMRLELMEMLTEDGCTIENPYPGIYHVTGHHHFRLQIIVSRLLDENSHGWLTALTRQLTENKLKILLDCMDRVDDGEYKNYSQSVLDIAINANRELFDRLYKEGKNMIEGLRRYYTMDKIRDIISLCRRLNTSDEVIVEQLMEMLPCDEDTAWNHIRRFDESVVVV